MNSDEITDLRRKELEESKRLWREHTKSNPKKEQEDCRYNPIYGENMAVMKVYKTNNVFVKPKLMETDWNISTNVAVSERNKRILIEFEALLHLDLDE